MSTDQAQALRDRAVKAPQIRLPALTVGGGKGGIGKTCIAVNLAVQMASLGVKPLLVDWDLGLANSDILLGVSPKQTLAQTVLDRKVNVKDIIIEAHGIGLVSAASGIEELTHLTDHQLSSLLADLGRAAKDYDLIIFDTAAGIHREVLASHLASKIQLIILTPEPTSLTDAYALIKLLASRKTQLDIRVLVNMCDDQAEAQAHFQRLRKVVTTYLGIDLTPLGHLGRHRGLHESIRARRPLALTKTAPFSQGLWPITMRLKGERWKD